MVAIVAAYADKTSVEQSTVEVLFELPLDMGRQTEAVRCSVAHLLEKIVEVLVNDLIEDRLFRLAPLIRAFHDRHVNYSEDVVKAALTDIRAKFATFDITIDGKCKDCKDREEKIAEKGLPAPYGVVNWLMYVSSKLRTFLIAQPGSWRLNVFTSLWCQKYMEAVRAGGKQKEAAEMFEGAGPDW